jgi:hypothetical protein
MLCDVCVTAWVCETAAVVAAKLPTIGVQVDKCLWRLADAVLRMAGQLGYLVLSSLTMNESFLWPCWRTCITCW